MNTVINQEMYKEVSQHYFIPMLLVVVFVFYTCSSLTNTLIYDNLNTPDNSASVEDGSAVSFPFFLSPPISETDLFFDLTRIIHQYKTDVDRLIATLTMSYNKAIRSERILFSDDKNISLLSSTIESRISHTAQVLELDGFILETLLKPFKVTLGLPSPYDAEFNAPSTQHDSKQTIIDLDVDPTHGNHSYDSGVQIIAHITRDWTFLGRPIRKSLYEFFILQLLMHRNDRKNFCCDVDTLYYSVLIPGAGLGRLAKDLFDYGFYVEANEVSTAMASAAYSLLHYGQKNQGKVHPFAFDFLMNEVSSKDRYQEVSFPDTDIIYNIRRESTSHHGSLSYTVGDFVQTYSIERRSESFDSVVTCFFIDTATNIYEYILIIRHVLKKGGMWINVGPLQWHRNSTFRPSVDELRSLIENMGFTIILWTLDTEPMNYRHFDNEVRYTKYEGFIPVRFVAQRTLHTIDDIYVTSVIRELRRDTSK